MALEPLAQTLRILHVRPFNPARTAIAEYACHFAKALQLIPGAEVSDFLPPSLSEDLGSGQAREAIRDFVERAAGPLQDASEPVLVHVEEGNALHREFWAGYYLQEVLPRARFFCTIHDPPKFCSNPYRYVATEFGGRTPVRMLNVALTKAAETLVQWRKRRVESRFARRCEGAFALSKTGAETLRRHPLFRGVRVHYLPHVFDLESLGIADCGLRIADSPIRDCGLRTAELGPQHSALSTQHSALSSQSSVLSPQHSALSTQHSALSSQSSALSTQDSALSTQHSALSSQDSVLTVLFCFLNAGKGIETLVDAFEILLDRLEGEAAPARQRLLIFGGVAPGERAARYVAGLGERIAQSRHAARIELRPGFVPDEERDRALAQADVLVLPFPATPVPFSSAGAVRALALGKAVVAARANTIPEVIRHGETGLLFPDNDPAALAEALHALTLDPALRARLGAKARRMIQEHHLPDRVAQALADAYGHSSPSLSAYTNPLT
jgi:glycosyltransferase involved in cell wall biosynthesis